MIAEGRLFRVRKTKESFDVNERGLLTRSMQSLKLTLEKISMSDLSSAQESADQYRIQLLMPGFEIRLDGQIEEEHELYKAENGIILASQNSSKEHVYCLAALESAGMISGGQLKVKFQIKKHNFEKRFKLA